MSKKDKFKRSSNYWCVVPECKSDSRKWNKLDKYPWMAEVTFLPFPTEKKNRNLRSKWIQMIRRPLDYVPLSHHRVCSRHFKPDGKFPELFPWNNYGQPVEKPRPAVLVKRESFMKSQSDNTQSETLTDTDDDVVDDGDGETDHDEASFSESSDSQKLPTSISVPCQSLPIGVTKYETVETSSSDSTPCTVTGTSNTTEQAGSKTSDHTYSNKHSNRDENVSHSRDIGIQTDTKMRDVDDVLAENEELRNILNDKDTLLRNLFVEKVTKSDKSIKEYTGLPNLEIFNELSNITINNEPNLKYWLGQQSEQKKQYQETPNNKKPGPARKLSRYQEFVLTLVRFRLALPVIVMSDLFGVSRSRVSSIFTTWIFYLYFILKDFIVWPSRELIKKYMPKSFKKLFPRTRAIIDCSEIFIQRPKDPTVNARTYSSYKSHNTFKYLVSITPSGAFNFISQIWGGNTSDRYLTEHSGFLDKVSPGDEIMADRGFTIRDLLTERHAYLNIPPFTRKCTWGKGRYLTKNQIKRTRQIANLRIHVERAIQRLKSFKLLGQTLPWCMKSLIHPMTVVGAFFCNLKKPLVK